MSEPVEFKTFEEMVSAAAEHFGVPRDLVGEYKIALVVYLEGVARKPAFGLGSLSLGNGYVEPEIEQFTRKLNNKAVFIPADNEYWSLPSTDSQFEARKAAALSKIANTRAERVAAFKERGD